MIVVLVCVLHLFGRFLRRRRRRLALLEIFFPDGPVGTLLHAEDFKKIIFCQVLTRRRTCFIRPAAAVVVVVLVLNVLGRDVSIDFMP